MKLEAALDTPGYTEQALVYTTYKLRSTRQGTLPGHKSLGLFVLGPLAVPGEIPEYVPENTSWVT